MRNINFGHKLVIGLTILFLSISSAFGRNVVKNLPSFDNDRLNFGFTLGITYMNFTSQSTGKEEYDKVRKTNDIWYSDVPSLTPGFHVGIISSLRLGRYFNFRVVPTISLGQRNLQFVTFNEDGDPTYREGDGVPVKSTFIEIPMLIKYKAVRDGNARPYLIGGINPRYDLARSKKDDILLKPMDLYFEIGVGSDFYLQFFRFGVEAKFSVGLSDMLDRNRNTSRESYNPQYTNSIDKLLSRLFVISFNFE